MKIDTHAHIGKDEDGESYSLEELFRDMAESGITHTVVFPFANSDEKLITDSLSILEAAEKDSRLIAFARFNPNTITKEQLTNLLEKDFKGIKLHPDSQNFLPSDERFFWIYEAIQEKCIPILFHNKVVSGESSNPKHIIEIARQFPKLKVIIGHFFGDDFSVVDDAKSLPNVYVETSIYSRTQRIEMVINKGFNRLMLGSDAPYNHQEVAVKIIKRSKIPEETKEAIFNKTAINLFGIETFKDK